MDLETAIKMAMRFERICQALEGELGRVTNERDALQAQLDEVTDHDGKKSK